MMRPSKRMQPIKKNRIAPLSRKAGEGLGVGAIPALNDPEEWERNR